jgi:hypothetical protein
MISLVGCHLVKSVNHVDLVQEVRILISDCRFKIQEEKL